MARGRSRGTQSGVGADRNGTNVGDPRDKQEKGHADRVGAGRLCCPPGGGVKRYPSSNFCSGIDLLIRGDVNLPLPRSIVTAASPKTSRRRSPAPKLGSTPPRSSFSLGDWCVPDATYTILSRTLRLNK
jgi:hypothetical protein